MKQIKKIFLVVHCTLLLAFSNNLRAKEIDRMIHTDQLCTLCESKNSCSSSFCQGTLIDGKLITAYHCLTKPKSYYQNSTHVRCGTQKHNFSYYQIEDIHLFTKVKEIKNFSSYNEFQENDHGVLTLKKIYSENHQDNLYKKNTQKISLFDWNDTGLIDRFFRELDDTFIVPEYYLTNFQHLNLKHSLRQANGEIVTFQKNSYANYKIRKGIVCINTQNTNNTKSSLVNHQVYPLTDKYHSLILYNNFVKNLTKHESFNTAYLATPYYLSTKILRNADSGGSLLCYESEVPEKVYLLGVNSTSGPTWSFLGTKFLENFNQIKAKNNSFELLAVYPHKLDYYSNYDKLISDLVSFNEKFGQIYCEFTKGLHKDLKCSKEIYFNLNKQYLNYQTPSNVPILVNNHYSQERTTLQLNNYFFMNCIGGKDFYTLPNSNRQLLPIICSYDMN